MRRTPCRPFSTPCPARLRPDQSHRATVTPPLKCPVEVLQPLAAVVHVEGFFCVQTHPVQWAEGLGSNELARDQSQHHTPRGGCCEHAQVSTSHDCSRPGLRSGHRRWKGCHHSVRPGLRRQAGGCEGHNEGPRARGGIRGGDPVRARGRSGAAASAPERPNVHRQRRRRTNGASSCGQTCEPAGQHSAHPQASGAGHPRLCASAVGGHPLGRQLKQPGRPSIGERAGQWPGSTLGAQAGALRRRSSGT